MVVNRYHSVAELEPRPTAMEVDLDALSSNFRVLRERVAPAILMPVLKANAYGHGLVPCAHHLVRDGATCIGVAFLEEGAELRRAGIEVPILVFGGIFGEQIPNFLDYDLDLTASSVGKLQRIDEIAGRRGKRARVHLKIDTGMERIGVHYYSAQSLLDEALRTRNCEIVGIFSHFAAADEKDPSLTKLQLERFLECTDYYTRRADRPPLRHIANSGGVLQHPESHLDMVRPGLALFGVVPSDFLQNRLPLKPVMKLKSTVVFFKVVKKGAGVSYGHEWVARQDTRIVTIPLGYGDGFFRRLSNRGVVLIRGKRYPIVGRVCMDQLMVDLGPDGEAYNGDEVVLIGSQGAERITVEEVARDVGTIAHEIVVSTNMRVPRRYSRDGATLPHQFPHEAER